MYYGGYRMLFVGKGQNCMHLVSGNHDNAPAQSARLVQQFVAKDNIPHGFTNIILFRFCSLKLFRFSKNQIPRGKEQDFQTLRKAKRM